MSVSYTHLENLLAGFVAGVVGKGIMTKEEAQTFMQTQMDAVKAKAMEKKYADRPVIHFVPSVFQ